MKREYYKYKPGSSELRRCANLRDTDLRGRNLKYANLYKSDFYEADLRGADLRKADVSFTKLNRADLRGADLRGADMSEAYLNGADLRGADLRGADLKGMSLHLAKFKNTKGIIVFSGTKPTDMPSSYPHIGYAYWFKNELRVQIEQRNYPLNYWLSETDDKIKKTKRLYSRECQLKYVSWINSLKELGEDDIVTEPRKSIENNKGDIMKLSLSLTKKEIEDLNNMLLHYREMVESKEGLIHKDLSKEEESFLIDRVALLSRIITTLGDNND